MIPESLNQYGSKKSQQLNSHKPTLDREDRRTIAAAIDHFTKAQRGLAHLDLLRIKASVGHAVSDLLLASYHAIPGGIADLWWSWGSMCEGDEAHHNGGQLVGLSHAAASRCRGWYMMLDKVIARPKSSNPVRYDLLGE